MTNILQFGDSFGEIDQYNHKRIFQDGKPANRNFKYGEDAMKNLFRNLLMVSIVCFLVGCTDKDSSPELDSTKSQVKAEDQNKEIPDTEKIEIVEEVKKLALECAEVFGTLEQEPYMKYYLNSDIFTFVINGQTIRSYSAFYDKVESSIKNLKQANVEYMDMYVDVFSREFAVVHGPFNWTAIYQDGTHEEAKGHMSFVYVLHDREWKIVFASEIFPIEAQ